MADRNGIHELRRLPDGAFAGAGVEASHESGALLLSPAVRPSAGSWHVVPRGTG